MKFGLKDDSLIGLYLNLKETGSTSDYPNVLANVLHKLLIKSFNGVLSPWKMYCKTGELSDFKTADRVSLSEGQDLLEVTVDAPYQNMKVSDRKYQISLATFGRLFQIFRQVIINDDLQAFKDIPAIIGRAAKRTLVKKIVAKLEANGAAYDGTALFADRTGSANGQLNAGVVNLAATAAGVTTLNAGVSAIRLATDPDSGEKMGLTPKTLVVHPNDELIADWLLHSTQIDPVSTSGGPNSNPLQKLNLQLAVEPFLTFAHRFYLFADPEEAPAIEVSFLNGQEEPEIFQKSADAVRVGGGGGRDDYGYEFDDISYKVRWDFATALGMYQGAYKGGN